MRQGLKAALVVLGAAVLSSGCASTLAVRSLQPAKYNLGAAKQLVVVESEGRRSAREELLAELQSQARATGYFTTVDKTDSGITMKAAGNTVNIQNAAQPQAAGEVWVRMDVLEWGAERTTKMVPIMEDVVDKNGKKTGQQRQVGERSEHTIQGKVLLAVTASNASGKAILAEAEYEANGAGESEDQARINAGRQAIARFLADVTPTTVVRNVRLDEDDKGQETILKSAKDGDLAGATAQMREYLKAHPNSASAQYNLAVFLDAAGSYQEAVDMVTAAIHGSTKDFYGEARVTMQKHLDDAMALAQ